MHTLSITLEDSLYYRLKQAVPNRKISKFVAETIKNVLDKETRSLHHAYAEAYSDKERNEEAKLWDATNENWD